MVKRLIFIELLGTPESCSNTESAFLSSWVISGFIIMPLGKEVVLDKIEMASNCQWNLTRMDRGLVALALNLPCLKESRILYLWKSGSTVWSKSATLSISCLKRSSLEVSSGHSLIPETTIFDFRSTWETLSVGVVLWATELVDTECPRLIKGTMWWKEAV